MMKTEKLTKQELKELRGVEFPWVKPFYGQAFRKIKFLSFEYRRVHRRLFMIFYKL